MGLNRLVQQGVIFVGDQLVPLVTRDAHREVVGIESGAADHGQNLAIVRIHSDDGAIFIGQGLFGGNLQIHIDGEFKLFAGNRRS